jgi:uncharacterized damage-inducible protein DinB
MSTIVENILNEFHEEMPATRRLLERVPADKLSWKPHQKSRSLGELATHVANIPGMVEKIANFDEFSPSGLPVTAATSVEDIRASFEKNARSGEELLGNMTEEAALGSWRFVFKGKELFRKPRVAALRTNVLNHLYHHRGQLSVYLRLLEVPVPVVYGPTADENPFA